MRAMLKISFLVLVIIIAGLGIRHDPLLVVDESAVTTESEWWEVVSVIDGDTIEVRNGEVTERVRYIGIDAPESYPEPSECYGKEATEYNRKLLSGVMVRLERDKSDTDKYGRWLRYVYAGDVFVNKELVEGGYAVAKMYQPDVQKSQEFAAAALSAQEGLRGLWAECSPKGTWR